MNFAFLDKCINSVLSQHGQWPHTIVMSYANYAELVRLSIDFNTYFRQDGRAIMQYNGVSITPDRYCHDKSVVILGERFVQDYPITPERIIRNYPKVAI